MLNIFESPFTGYPIDARLLRNNAGKMASKFSMMGMSLASFVVKTLYQFLLYTEFFRIVQTFVNKFDNAEKS